MNPWVAWALALGALAGCHDWERFSRPPDASALGPAPDGGVVGELSGAFGCEAPYLLLPVFESGVAPRIDRFAMGGATPSRCSALRVWGFRTDEPIRAVAAYGDRVLAAGDRGPCVLEVQPDLLRGRFAPWPLSGGTTVPRDAFVFANETPRFAASFAIGTAGTITHVVVEEEPGALTRVMTATSSPAIPSALVGMGLLRSIAHDPMDLSTLYGAREAADYLVSVRADGTGRSVVRTSSSPDIYETVAAGPAMEGSAPRLAMTLRSAGNQFSFVTGSSGSNGARCDACRRIAHVLPLDAEMRTFAVVCSDASDGPGLYVYRGGSCTRALELPRGAVFGRAAVRYAGAP